MKPPYEITSEIVNLVSSVSEKIGEVNAVFLSKQSPALRKQNKIKTIHSSLSIKGNTLSEDQITALLENKRVIGPQKDVKEVLNAINVYEKLNSFVPDSEASFLEAHKMLMSDLIDSPGKYRKSGVGIAKGSEIAHIAPSFENVAYLMKDLFLYLKNDGEISLIKSCVFHYEMEFIHPFLDGNGRMGWLWQSVVLLNKYPVFEFLPVETLISKNQDAYYRALALSDNSGSSTIFIKYMLEIINESLGELLNYNNRTLSDRDRIDYFLNLNKESFTRKDYMNIFKDISSATASRDLLKAVGLGFIEKSGDKNKTIYKKTND